MPTVVLVAGIAAIGFFALIWVSSRYKRCPSNRVLVIYGRHGGEGTSSRCVHGGGAMVWPIVQQYAWLDLEPIPIAIDLQGALSKQNIRVNTPSSFTVSISTEHTTMQNAAERLLGMGRQPIEDLARDIIFGQMRVVIATMDIEEINADREQLISKISESLDVELRKVGLHLINVNIQDINDDSGYIDALGREAASTAVNQAKIKVADQERAGEIGKALADRQRRVEVAQANAEAEKGEAEAARLQRISVAAADATATEGENDSKGKIAESDSERRKREAEADQNAVAVERVSEANAQKEAYAAETQAEQARALRDEAAQHAAVVVPAKVELEKVRTEAQAEADRVRLTEEGAAAGMLAVATAKAEGERLLLAKRAEGFAKLVSSAGGTAQMAAMLMLTEQTPAMTEMVAKAVAAIEIDSLNIWGGGSNDNGSGLQTLVADFFKSVPPALSIAEQVGYKGPGFLGEMDNGDSTDDNSDENVAEELAAALAEVPEGDDEFDNA